MDYFDAHNHLQDFGSAADLETAMRAAAALRVQGMLCCGTSPEDWGEVLEIANRYEGVIPCFGLHPWFSAEEGWQGRLEEFLRRVPRACVGEIGLDGVKESAGQEENFTAQLKLAGQFGRPAVIHCVKSWGRMKELLASSRLPAFLLHGYGGPPEMIKEFYALGGYFSFGLELADPAREKLRAALRAAPAERLLFETEAPGGCAGPAGITAVVEAAAAALGLPAEELAKLSLANAQRFTEAAQ